MKKTVSIFIALILLLGVLPVNFAQVAQAAAPGTYNPGDIAVINKMIDDNGLNWPKAPADGSSVPKRWDSWDEVLIIWSDDVSDKRVIEMSIYLKGGVNLKGLDFLKSFDCEGRLDVLDISKNTKLELLNITECKLFVLDVSKNTKLKYLYATQNNLKVMDVSKNTKLERFSCANNKLVDLDVSNNTKLKHLDCSSNRLTDINVSKNTELEYLRCSIYNLTELDVSKNTKLKELGCIDSKLTKLDVSNNPSLKVLKCNSNQLTKLDVSNNKELKLLIVSGNQLSKLDVRNCEKLQKLYCGGNELTKLDVRKNTKLIYLSCTRNYFKSRSDVKGIENVKEVKFDPQRTVAKVKSVKTKVVSATSAKISWGKVADATGYQVRRATSKNGTYKTVKTTTGTSFTNTGLTAGKTYYYKVRAYKTVDGKKIYGDYSSIVSVKPKPLKVTGVKATKAASGQAKISWSKQANVTGYQIRRATSKNGTYKNVGSTTNSTYTNKKLTPGKTYYYKVRAYKTVSGKRIYGAYSSIKSVKV